MFMCSMCWQLTAQLREHSTTFVLFSITSRLTTRSLKVINSSTFDDRTVRAVLGKKYLWGQAPHHLGGNNEQNYCVQLSSIKQLMYNLCTVITLKIGGEVWARFLGACEAVPPGPNIEPPLPHRSHNLLHWTDSLVSIRVFAIAYTAQIAEYGILLCRYILWLSSLVHMAETSETAGLRGDRRECSLIRPI